MENAGDFLNAYLLTEPHIFRAHDTERRIKLTFSELISITISLNEDDGVTYLHVSKYAVTNIKCLGVTTFK